MGLPALKTAARNAGVSGDDGCDQVLMRVLSKHATDAGGEVGGHGIKGSMLTTMHTCMLFVSVSVECKCMLATLKGGRTCAGEGGGVFLVRAFVADMTSELRRYSLSCLCNLNCAFAQDEDFVMCEEHDPQYNRHLLLPWTVVSVWR